MTTGTATSRTGVVHVLVISGQHLSILAWCCSALLRLLGVRRRWGAAGVASLLLAYALLTGLHAPVLAPA